MAKKLNQKNPSNGDSNKQIATPEMQAGVDKKGLPLSLEDACIIYYTLYGFSEEKRIKALSSELDDEDKARIVEIQYRSIEDVVRYGSCVRRIEHDEEQANRARDTELNNYLNDEFNLKLYHDMTSSIWGGLCNPLEFFKILQAQYNFVSANLKEPITIEKQLRELNLGGHQKLYLLQALTGRLKSEGEKNSQFKNACKIVRYEWEKHWRKLNQVSLNRTNEEFHSYNIFSLQSHLQTFPDTKAKIEYLIKLKADLQQLPPPDCEPFFIQQLGIEIEKLRQLLDLERESPDQPESDENERVRGLRPKLLALCYLLEQLGVERNNERWSPFLAYLIGSKSPEHIRQSLSKRYQPETTNHKTWKANMLQLRQYFSDIGLQEIVKNIDSEIAMYDGREKVRIRKM